MRLGGGVAGLGIAALLAPASARSEATDAETYCAYVRAVSGSESALLLSPSAFTGFGLVNDGAASGGASTVPPNLRLTVGLHYDVVSILRGTMLYRRASAECARYRSVSQLNTFLQAHRESSTPGALSARLAALESALPHAAEVLEAARSAVESGHATVEELNATQLRVDGLRAAASETRVELESSGTAEAPPTKVREVLVARDVAEEQVERVEGQLREAAAWDLSVRAGYDRIFGLRDQTPLFAVVTLSMNLGFPWQFAGEEKARTARVRWTRQQAEGVDARVEQLLRRLTATLAAEQKRLGEVAVLRADLEGRMKDVEFLEGRKARAYREYLWFDLVKVRAEHEYLRVQVAELRAALGEEARSP